MPADRDAKGAGPMSEGGDQRKPWERALDNAYRGPLEAPERSEGGEARNHEAEVEAVAYVLHEAPPEADLANVAKAVIAALDVVRCAQGRDTDALRSFFARYDRLRSTDAEDFVALVEEHLRPLQGRDTDAPGPAYTASDAERLRKLAARSPQGEDHEPTADELERDCEAIAEARWAMHPRYGSQGEDHEAGIEAALAVWPGRILTRAAVEAVVAAYLSRCSSPKRLGELLDGETK